MASQEQHIAIMARCRALVEQVRGLMFMPGIGEEDRAGLVLDHLALRRIELRHGQALRLYLPSHIRAPHDLRPDYRERQLPTGDRA
jgi:hypothetical protein